MYDEVRRCFCLLSYLSSVCMQEEEALGCDGAHRLPEAGCLGPLSSPGLQAGVEGVSAGDSI